MLWLPVQISLSVRASFQRFCTSDDDGPCYKYYHSFFPIICYFILVLCERDYISAVLNCSALLFIPEIDDQLPKILGYWEDNIIKHFIITESMVVFDDTIHTPENDFTTIEYARRNLVCGLQFDNFYITDML